MAGDTKLIAPIGPGGDTEFVNLARRLGTTPKLLAQLAVRQLLAAARMGMLPDLPPLDNDIESAASVWLPEADRTELNILASRQTTTPEALASVAIRGILAQARAGALPMLKPPQPAEKPEPPSWEEIHAYWNLWDAQYLDDPGDLPEQAPQRPARTNFSKAKYILERLERLNHEGINPSDPSAALRDIDKLVTVTPT